MQRQRVRAIAVMTLLAIISAGFAVRDLLSSEHGPPRVAAVRPSSAAPTRAMQFERARARKHPDGKYSGTEIAPSAVNPSR